jgi:hypothetical protein
MFYVINQLQQQSSYLATLLRTEQPVQFVKYYYDLYSSLVESGYCVLWSTKYLSTDLEAMRPD